MGIFGDALAEGRVRVRLAGKTGHRLIWSKSRVYTHCSSLAIDCRHAMEWVWLSVVGSVVDVINAAEETR